MSQQTNTNGQQKVIQVDPNNIEKLKKAFAGNEELLIAMRSLWLGFKVSSDMKKLIAATFSDSNLLEIVRSKFFPKIGAEDKIGMAADFWFGTEVQIVDKDPQTVKQIVMYKKRATELYEYAFELLVDPTQKREDLTFYDPTDTFEKDPMQVELLARNQFIKGIEVGLTYLKTIAGEKAESVVEAKKRLGVNSSE